jgi:ribokinase
MADVIVIGSINIDLVVKVAHHPALAETVIGQNLQRFPGGKGANQATAIARLGGDVALIGKVGDDPFGEELVASLNKDGVDTSHVTTQPGISTGAALIEVNERGENTIVVAPGANYTLLPPDIDAVEEDIASARLLVLQLEVPLATVEHCIRLASRYKVPIILNPAPAPSSPLSPALLKDISYLVPNEVEAGQLTEMTVGDMASARTAASTLVEQGVPTVIITLGDKGCQLATAQQQTYFPPVKVDAVDTTAAGDAFIGALAFGLAAGRPLEYAIRYATYVGALSVTRPGAQTSLPTHAELETFYGADQFSPYG